MGDIDETENRIAILQEQLSRAENALRRYINQQCPGPHRPIQHRDAKPPWCKACGRTGLGTRVKEITDE